MLVALLDGGADINAEDSRGDTPLHVAVSEPGRSEIVELLLECGAVPFARDAEGKTPREIALASGSADYVSSIEESLRNLRKRRDIDWVCPRCGSQMDRPDSERIDWYIRLGTWEAMTFVCGSCGSSFRGVSLDGEDERD